MKKKNIILLVIILILSVLLATTFILYIQKKHRQKQREEWQKEFNQHQEEVVNANGSEVLQSHLWNKNDIIGFFFYEVDEQPYMSISYLMKDYKNKKTFTTSEFPVKIDSSLLKRENYLSSAYDEDTKDELIIEYHEGQKISLSLKISCKLEGSGNTHSIHITVEDKDTGEVYYSSENES